MRASARKSIAPNGPVYQAGTLSGNPVAMAAGLATLEAISVPGFYEVLNQRTQQLVEGMEAAAQRVGVPLVTNRVGAMFGLFFSDRRVETYQQACACDVQRFNRFFHAMLGEGVYLAPSAFEAGFVSAAHSESIFEETLAAAERCFVRISSSI